MAVLDINEYAFQARDGRNNVVPTGAEPSPLQQVVVGAGSVQSAAFADTTRLVRVHSDVVCRVAFGLNPTAAATSMRLAAGSTEFFGVIPGHKVAVITST